MVGGERGSRFTCSFQSGTVAADRRRAPYVLRDGRRQGGNGGGGVDLDCGRLSLQAGNCQEPEQCRGRIEESPPERMLAPRLRDGALVPYVTAADPNLAQTHGRTLPRCPRRSQHSLQANAAFLALRSRSIIMRQAVSQDSAYPEVSALIRLTDPAV